MPSLPLLKNARWGIIDLPMADYLPYGFSDHLPHYHGDAVRQLLASAAILMLVGAPFYASFLGVELPFLITGALALVAVAALVNPHKKSIFLVAAVASGVGLVVFETWALYGYYDSNWAQFILREVIAVVFLAGFYFSMKTVRAFVLHKVGKHDEAGEFEEAPVPGTPEIKTANANPNPRANSWSDEFVPWFLKNGGNHGNTDHGGSIGAGRAEAAEDTGPRMSPGRSREETKPKYHPYEDTM